MNDDELIDFASRGKYIVICNDGMCNVYASMREISQTYKLDHSTISKALHKKKVCICKPKTMENICIRVIHM
jgi:hypothetical protein